MKKLNILCVDDQREVLAAIKKDLEIFTPAFTINDCESAAEAEATTTASTQSRPHLAGES